MDIEVKYKGDNMSGWENLDVLVKKVPELLEKYFKN